MGDGRKGIGISIDRLICELIDESHGANHSGRYAICCGQQSQGGSRWSRKEVMNLVGYQQHVTWRGEEVLTLEDVWPEKPEIMIVGLNPAPTSVASVHYYQGGVGQRQLGRLVDAGLFDSPSGSFLEEVALRANFGFTDLVKRPTAGEGDVPKTEQAYGRTELTASLRSRGVPLVVCVFRHPADAIMGLKTEVGFQTGATPWGGLLFRMPGPFSNSPAVANHMMGSREFLRSAR